MSPLAASPPLTFGIVTPCPRRSCAGNRITALRWAALLRGLGHKVFVEQEWSERPCAALLALHAWKSAQSVERFKQSHPERPVVVLLTGTDVYGPLGGELESNPVTLATLARADRLAVLQPRAILELPPALRAKARVVRQSAAPPRRREPPATDAFEVSVVGHLRDVKDPLRTALAARLLPAGSKLRVLHVGEALSDAMRAAAEHAQRENPRYRWLGRLSHGQSVELIARTRLHVLTSLSEGGANVVSEAIAAGVPVISSRIDGSLGILGDAYPGYFEPGDERALAQLLDRCERDARFLGALAQWCGKLRPLVGAEREQQALARLLAELLPAATETGRAGGASGPRLRELGAEVELPFTRLAASVKSGLARTPKALDCCWFYDEQGSRLFEEICATPEYYVTRAEDEILRDRAAEIVAPLPRDATLVELGSGSATKTRRLLDALLARDGAAARLRYVMIDISPSALAASARDLLARYPALEVVSICADYDDGIARLREVTAAPRLVLWLGSNVGNFHRPDAAAFLGRVRAQLDDADRLLVGIDLRKEKAVLERAYDDAAGVTARFNRNLLERVNRELGGDFDPAAFRHVAKYDEELGRIGMWLVSERAQRVRIDLLDLDVEFAAGEAIHTENSYKYSLAEIDELAAAARLRVAGQWLDARRHFSDTLFQPAELPRGGGR